MKKFLNKIEKATGIDIDGDGKVGDRPLPGHSSQHAYGYGNNMQHHRPHPHQQPAAATGPSAAFPVQHRPAQQAHRPQQHRPPPQGPALPPGWEMKRDPATGSFFYVNHTTKTTQWEPPGAAPAAAAPKFCSGCGSRFPAGSAKFCAECGAPAPEKQASRPQQAQAVQQHQLVLASQVWQPQHYTQMQIHNYHVGVGYQHAPTQPENTAIVASGRRKALLIGINYFGTSSELRGCINDVHHMRELLVSEGFNPRDIVILTDDQRDPQYLPTRDNILRACQWLVAGAQKGDVLFFHFSGHGSQKVDDSGMEEDGYNETICPVDMRQIIDDELWSNLVYPLPSGVRLTAIMDCCHSGTGLDLPFTWQRGWREDENPSHSCGDVQLFSGCQDDQCSSDGDVERFKIGGAMTNAFIRAYKAQPFQPYPEFLEQLRHNLRRAGFSQRPQLSSSQPFQVSDKVFSLTDGIVPNQNPSVGRLQRRKIRPSRNISHLFGGGGGEMLQAAVGVGMGMMLMDALFD